MSQQLVPLADRFWPKVDRSGGPDSCWNWTGHLNRQKYGTIRPGGSEPSKFTHRVAWEMANGPIPSGAYVLHRCDNPSCVNVRHLWLGSRADNAHDRDSKGRQSRGEKVNTAKLTEDDVRWIRANYVRQSEMMGGPALAKRFGVSQHAICCIVNWKTWKHLDP